MKETNIKCRRKHVCICKQHKLYYKSKKILQPISQLQLKGEAAAIKKYKEAPEDVHKSYLFV